MITDDIQKIRVRIEVVKGYAQTGQFAVAETIARSFEETHNRIDAMRILAKGLASAENERTTDIFAEALAEVRHIEDTWMRADQLREIALAMSKIKPDRFAAIRDQAHEVFHEAQQAIQTLPPDEQHIPLRELVYDLAGTGHWTEAETTARSIQDELWRADALGELAETIAKDDQEQARVLFSEAEKVVRRIEDTFDLAVALRDLATNLARAGHDRAKTLFDEACEAINQAQVDYSDADTLYYGLVRGLAYAGMPAEAEKVASSVEDPRWRDMALAAAVEISAEERQFDAAERIAHNIKDDGWRTTALVSLGDNLASVDSERAAAVFAQAAESAGIPTHNDRAWALRDLGETLAKLGNSYALNVFVEARAASRKISKHNERARWMGLLAAHVALSGTGQNAYHELVHNLLSETQTLIQGLADEWHRTWEPLNLAECYAENGLYIEAETMAQIIEDHGSHTAALGHVAAALQKSHHQEQAAIVFHEAVVMAHNIEKDEARNTILADLVKIMAWAGYYKEAEATLRDITDPEDQALSLCELSEALTEAKQFAEARRIAQEIQDEYWRAWALGALAPDLALNGQFVEAEEVARAVQDDFWEPAALRTLTSSLAKAGQYTEAERVARSIPNAWRRATALGHLAAVLIKGEDARATTILTEILEMTPGMEDKWERAETLRYLVETLDEVDYEQVDLIFTRAVEAAQEIDDINWKQSALSDLVYTLAAAQRYAQALMVAQAIEDNKIRSDALRAVASALVQEKRCAEALAVLGPRQPDDFIKLLACGAANVDWVEPALVAMGLRETVRILGWIFPDYRAVYEKLPSAD